MFFPFLTFHLHFLPFLSHSSNFFSISGILPSLPLNPISFPFPATDHQPAQGCGRLQVQVRAHCHVTAGMDHPEDCGARQPEVPQLPRRHPEAPHPVQEVQNGREATQVSFFFSLSLSCPLVIGFGVPQSSFRFQFFGNLHKIV